NGVKEDMTLIMAAVGGQRDEVVEKKPEDKKPEDKKPDDKKPDDKKPDDKKPDGKPAVEVQGVVTLDGKPADGKISFVRPDDKALSGDVKDGKYKVPGVKPGVPYKITVEVKEKGYQLYETPETTPLRYTIKEDAVKDGKETLDWELKKK